jgi:hypothetical protein
MYKYEDNRAAIFTEDGQVLFLEIRDRVKKLLGVSGAVRLEEAVKGSCGDSWHMLACVDRLVELGEIREIKQQGNVAGQDRIFVSAD